MAKLYFDAPGNAPAHLALRKAAVKEGFSEDLVRNLLWLINAHPRLIAYARVFEHVGLQLRSPIFAGSDLIDEISKHGAIDQFADCCEWIVGNRSRLSCLPGLGQLDHHSSNRNAHPQMAKGVVRHGIPAAMWNSHECASPKESRNPDELAAAKRYGEVQAHVLAAYMYSRSVVSTREFFESYTGKKERPVAPMRTTTVSPAIREFSHKRYVPLLIQFPKCDSTSEFATMLRNVTFDLSRLEDNERRLSRRYLNAVKDFFQKYQAIHYSGWRPSQSIRKGWGGGGGGRSRRSGYISCEAAPGVYFAAQSWTDEDPDLAGNLPRPVYVDFDPESDDDPLALERSGVCPSETLVESFSLIPPEEQGAAYLASQRQQNALEMQGQLFSFDYRNLTFHEVAEVYDIAQRAIDRCLKHRMSFETDIRDAMSGLMLKLSLCYGQTIERLADVEIAWESFDINVMVETHDGDAIFLVLRSGTPGDIDKALFVGLKVPAITPNYRTELPDELQEIDRDWVSAFVLPDEFNLGVEVIGCLKLAFPGKSVVAPFSDKKLLAGVANLLKQSGNERITKGKVSRFLGTQATLLSGDQSQAWLLLADRTRCDEPRMFYTRHRVDKLLNLFSKTARRIKRKLKIPVQTPVPLPNKHECGLPITVGTRFCVKHVVVTQLIRDLVDQLKDRNLRREDKTVFREYHNDYALLTILSQNLWTGVRNLTQPDHVYREWVAHGQGAKIFRFSLIEKQGPEHDKARPQIASAGLCQQFGYFKQHLEHVSRNPDFWLNTMLANAPLPFFYIDDTAAIKAVSPGWSAAQLERLTGYPIPENFHRAYLRTELLERGCPAKIVDAFLSHGNVGELASSVHSSFDYDIYFEILRSYLEPLIDAVGLVPVESRLIPFELRQKKRL